MGAENWEVVYSFQAAIEPFRDVAPDPDDLSMWRYAQFVSVDSFTRYYCGNDGAQGWVHESGFAIPDHCRYMGGCPEMWNQENAAEALAEQGGIKVLPRSPMVGFLVER